MGEQQHVEVTGGVSGWADGVVSSRRFQGAVLGSIVLGGVIVGLETIPAVHDAVGPLLRAIDMAIIAIFVIEAALKITAAGAKPMRYFGDPWNLFDFAITIVCVLPLDGQFAQVLRLARVARSLRLIKALPRLQLIVGALLRSLPSFGWITLLLFILLYVYSVMGVALFGRNDPERFGTLWSSMLTMFGILTLEGWVDIMREQMGGIPPADGGEALHRAPIAAPVFFVSFILSGTMVFLNLLVGVIVNSLSEGAAEAAEESAKESAKKAAKDAKQARRSPLPSMEAVDGPHQTTIAERLERLEASLDATLAEIRSLRESARGPR
ncbi:MAG: ion transporter [Planctomycetota bacterium]|nr:ion transporter [Planctomycetota bacterium]